MYELNEQELASVVGGHAQEIEIEKSFNKSFDNNKIIVKNVKVIAKGDYSIATAAIYIQSPEIYTTSSN